MKLVTEQQAAEAPHTADPEVPLRSKHSQLVELAAEINAEHAAYAAEVRRLEKENVILVNSNKVLLRKLDAIYNILETGHETHR